MQLVMLNFLIMFDVVFIFFLFLIAVTCIMNYMPGRRRRDEECEDVEDDVIPPPPLFACDGNDGDEGDDGEMVAGRDTYVVIPTPIETVGSKDSCPIHVV